MGRCANPYFIFIGIFITIKYWWEFKFVKAEVENKTNVKLRFQSHQIIKDETTLRMSH